MEERLERWSRLNEPQRVQAEDELAPDANEEYLLYQTLVGAWPLEPYTAEEYAEFVGRIQAYMLKALHEAKVHTSWINPNKAYDDAVAGVRRPHPRRERSEPFLEDFREFQQRISHYGLFNSLSQTLLKLASPGVPDTYQGTELWDFSLVDPDNRRPVDYDRRREMLAELQASESAGGDLRELARELVAAKEDGRIKLYVTHLTLQCRRENPGLFTDGAYVPLEAEGPRKDHVFGFARGKDGRWRGGGRAAFLDAPGADAATPADRPGLGGDRAPTARRGIGAALAERLYGRSAYPVGSDAAVAAADGSAGPFPRGAARRAGGIGESKASGGLYARRG